MGGGKFKSYSMVCRWRCGELFRPGDRPAEEVCLERLRVGVNCLWYLAVVVIFMGLGGAKSLVGLGGFKVIIWGRASYKGGRTNFFSLLFFLRGGAMTPLDTMDLSNYY